jgi:AcrR family transcriptional regulator
MESQRKRLTREESRAQTRARLLDAAYQVFATEGIEPASIDRIAELAGYSRGAFYSNFQTKEELLAALAERESERSAADFRAMEEAHLPPDQQVQVLREYALAESTDKRACLFYLELEMYGVRHPEVRPTIGEFVRRDTERAGRFLDRLFDLFGVTEHPPSELIVSSFIAMAQGLTMRQIVDPDTLSDEVVREALGLYFDSVITSCIPHLRRPRTDCAAE